MSEENKIVENSTETTQEKDTKSVKLSGKVTVKQPNIIERFKNYISENSETIKDYVISDLVFPTIRRLADEIITYGKDIFLYGDSRGPSRDFRDSRPAYRSYYDSRRTRRDDRRSSDQSRSRIISYDNIIFEYRKDAEEVLYDLIEIAETYEIASVGDFYNVLPAEMVKELRFTNYMINRYGWTLDAIKSSKVMSCKDGYFINLPKPCPID